MRVRVGVIYISSVSCHNGMWLWLTIPGGKSRGYYSCHSTQCDDSSSSSNALRANGKARLRAPDDSSVLPAKFNERSVLDQSMALHRRSIPEKSKKDAPVPSGRPVN